jgi:hypothetical protein
MSTVPVGAIVGAVLAAILLLSATLFAIWHRLRMRNRRAKLATVQNRLELFTHSFFEKVHMKGNKADTLSHQTRALYAEKDADQGPPEFHDVGRPGSSNSFGATTLVGERGNQDIEDFTRVRMNALEQAVNSIRAQLGVSLSEVPPPYASEADQ